MALVLVFALIALVLFGFGFTVKWLFIAAVIAALLSVVFFFTGRSNSARV